MDLNGVRVHYNSVKPAQLNAAAYAQGQAIHLGPRQEEHLPHEAWHVVQQMQGRVRPTMHTGGVPINDDAALEHEADVMGKRGLGIHARQERATPRAKPSRPVRPTTQCNGVVQRLLYTHQTGSDEGERVEGIGDQGFINIYARHLAEDTKALVDGEPRGIAGLRNTLKKGHRRRRGGAIEARQVAVAEWNVAT